MFPALPSALTPTAPGPCLEVTGTGSPGPGTSAQSVVIHLLRTVDDPTWAPAPAADRLARDVDDPQLLRRARALLRVVTRQRISRSHARTFATLSLAINQIEGRGRSWETTTVPLLAAGMSS